MSDGVKKAVSNQWMTGSLSEMIGDAKKKAGEHDHCQCGDCHQNLEEEQMDRPPDNAGIIEIVRWAMENDKILRSPPVEHMFCGCKIPCIYAGTIPTRTFSSSLNAKKAAIKHCFDFASIVMVETSESNIDGMPNKSRYPSLSALFAVLDVNSDPDEPKVHMLIYDGARSTISGEPVIGYIEDIHEAVSSARKGDDLYGLREMDFEAFVVDMTSVVRDHLKERMRKQEEAIREAQEAGVEVIDNSSGGIERGPSPQAESNPEPDDSFFKDRIENLEKRSSSIMTSKERRKKLERKIASLKKKSSSADEPWENQLDGEDHPVGSCKDDTGR